MERLKSSLFLTPYFHLTSPLNPTTTPSSLSHKQPASVCGGGGDAKNRRSRRAAAQTRCRGSGSESALKKEEEVLQMRGDAERWRSGVGGGRGGEGGLFLNVQVYRRLRGTWRLWRVHRVRRDPAPSGPGGASPAPPQPRSGGCGWCFSLVGGSRRLPSLHRFSPVEFSVLVGARLGQTCVFFLLPFLLVVVPLTSEHKAPPPPAVQ